MKFKAVTNADAPASFVEALDALRPVLEQKIAHECFGVPLGQMGPAEMYVQETDFAGGQQKPFVNYNASAITLKPGRDFQKALTRLKEILITLLSEHWRGVSIQLMIVIATSSADGTKAPLFESVTTYDIPR